MGSPHQSLRSDTNERSYLFEVRPKFWEAKPIPHQKLVSAECIEDWSIHVYCSLECDGYDLGASGPAGYHVRNQRDISSEFDRTARWQHESCVADGWEDCLGGPFR